MTRSNLSRRPVRRRDRRMGLLCPASTRLTVRSALRRRMLLFGFEAIATGHIGEDRLPVEKTDDDIGSLPAAGPARRAFHAMGCRKIGWLPGQARGCCLRMRGSPGFKVVGACPLVGRSAFGDPALDIRERTAAEVEIVGRELASRQRGLGRVCEGGVRRTRKRSRFRRGGPRCGTRPPIAAERMPWA